MKHLSMFVFAICFWAFSPHAVAQPTADASAADPVSLQLSEDGAGYKADILLNGDPRCFFGDMDAMMLDNSRNPDARLILSIEPLVPAEHFPVVSTTVEEIRKIYLGKYRTTLVLPKTSRAVPLGIYLCFDSAGANRCGEKTVTPLSDVIKEYRLENGQTPKVPAKVEDRVYFFRFMMFENGVVSFFDKAMTDQRYQKLENMLKGASPHSAKKTFDAVKKLNTLQSMPLKQKGEKELELVLPFYNPTKCSVMP